MKIHMAGIKDADLETREKFSFTKDKLLSVLEKYKSLEGVGGAVIISTCNRTEVYVSAGQGMHYNIAKILCAALEQDYEKHKKYFYEKEEKEALSHLCFVGAGAQSQILGDDQIITQVREALEYARGNGFSDSYTETFFRTAIGAAKEIKTKVILRDAKVNSAPHKAILKLKDLCDLSQQQVLVIGNGQVGRLMSELLIEENAKVTITLREYKKGTIQIPRGADTISYGHRYKAVEQATIIVSATTSPHHTIHYEDCRRLRRFPEFMVDLAVPRDIDPRVKDLGVTVFTIDDLCDRAYGLPVEKRKCAEEIIAKHTERYDKWADYKGKFAKNALDDVVDTPYPYVDPITHNTRTVCETADTKHLRLIRERGEQNRDIICVPNAEEAVALLKDTAGNILLTTGSKELSAFTAIENYADRVYVRLLPMAESLQKAESLGFQSKNIICMQGPFDFELNKAMLASIGASCLVTRDTGDAGGFSEKVSAALAVGCKVIVIARPAVETDLTFSEILDFCEIKDTSPQGIGQRPFFPFFFDLTDKRVMVVGGGQIAQKRIEMLLRFGANILLISPALTKTLQQLAGEAKVKCVGSTYKQVDLERWKPFLVMAATDDRMVNQTVKRDAKKLGIPHIIADCKEECDAYFPAIAENDSFIAGIISKDGNHRAVKSMVKEVRRMLDGQ